MKKLLIIKHSILSKKASHVVACMEDPKLAFVYYMKLANAADLDSLYELVKMDDNSAEYHDLMENNRYEGILCYGRPRIKREAEAL